MIDILNEDLKQQFIDICKSNISRAGIEGFMEWLEGTDFFVAPASTRFHGNHEGGLLEHSMNVYRVLRALVKLFKLDITLESVTIAALFHDTCKANYYAVSTRNVKDEQTGQWRKEPFYKTDDQMPLGHGEKSVILIMKHMQLTDDEMYAIRWHMGGYDSAVKGGDFAINKAYEMSKLAVLLHVSDMIASNLMEARND